jgi:hypothetical protein
LRSWPSVGTSRRTSIRLFSPGWECAAIPVIQPLLQVQPGEVLINLMTSWITRFLQDPTKPFKNLLDPDYEKIIELTGDEREEAIVNAYTEAVRKAGNFPYACTVAWIAMWRRYLSAIWRKRSYTRVQPCPMTRLSLAAVTISLETISD